MPVEFSDAEDVDELGTAGFMRIEEFSEQGVYRGAVFVVNARGEPLEFTYNSVQVPNSFLWRSSDIRRHATRRIATSMFQTCQSRPKFIICLGKEVDHDVFCRDLHLAIPVCRIVPALETVGRDTSEQVEAISGDAPLNAFWHPEKPLVGSTESRLFSRLAASGLLLEPFERIARGLAEVYRDSGEHEQSTKKG